MPRGRKPNPIELQVLHGDPGGLGKERIAMQKSVEPPDDPNGLQPPADLPENQRRLWIDAIACAPRGVLKRIDTSVLRVWVAAYDLHMQAMAQQARTTLLVREPGAAENSMPIASPLLKIIDQMAARILKSAAELGFTPTSRPRLVLAGQNVPLPALPPGAKPRLGRPPRHGPSKLVSIAEFVANHPARRRDERA
jgi:P27 family predicted phage terminase small subunit